MQGITRLEIIVTRAKGEWAKRAMAALVIGVLVALSLSGTVAAQSMVVGSFRVGLLVSNVSASDISQSGATISWDTNGPATSQVFYDTVSRAGLAEYRYQTEEDTSPVNEHSVRLTYLSPGTRYYYRVRSQIPDTDLVAISDEYSFTTRTRVSPSPTPPPSPATPLLELEVVVEGEATTHPISIAGELQENIERTSPDGNMTVVISRGTVALDDDGNPLRVLTVNVALEPPAPPRGAHFIGLAYSFAPPGATFNPPLTLTWQYDPADVPEDVAEEDLVVAYYSEEAGEWVKVPSVVDVQTHTITTEVSHFTTFAVIAAPRTGYALTISSTAGGSVTTPGEGTFTCDEGTVVNLIAGADEGYRFVRWTGDVDTIGDVNAATTSVMMEGDYSIRANFETVPPSPPRPFPWWWIVIGVVIAGLVPFFILRRRKKAA